MKQLVFKKTIIVLSLVAAAILIATVFWIGRREVPPRIDETKTVDAPNAVQSPAIIQRADVQYSEREGFVPHEFIQHFNAQGIGCLTIIANESDTPLTLRLNPYTPADSNGFPYPAIPPRSAGLIDARYHMKYITLHNHENPKQELTIHFDTQCQ